MTEPASVEPAPLEPAFFEIADGALAPRPHAHSPWSTDMLHGRLLAGIAAREIEQRSGDAEMQVARLTVDLFRSPPMSPVAVQSRVLRDGRRVRVVEVVCSCDGVEMSHTTALLLRRADQPGGEVWSPPPWDVPHPDDVPAPELPPGSPPRSRMQSDMRPIGGRGFGTVGRKQVWLRDSVPLVDGEELSPLVRAALASDFASPLSHSGAAGLQFINADITLHLARLPRGEWIGFDVTAHISDAGVAIGQCALYDTEGPIGLSAASAVSNRMAR